MGDPSLNQNNHPFTNSDKSIGLVHNGRLDDSEYRNLKVKYDPRTQCDSEILLRIFEASEYYQQSNNTDYSHRLSGIKDIFSLINEGHMAVAVGERGQQGERVLWLFRNCYRPLWVVDVRTLLGQIFFVSEPSIWESAIRECNLANFCRSQKLMELPTEEIWQFRIPKDSASIEDIQRFSVEKSNYHPWQFDGKYCGPIEKKAAFEVLTKLDAKDRPIYKKEHQLPIMDDVATDVNLRQLIAKCDNISSVIISLKVEIKKRIEDGSMSQIDCQQLFSSLDDERIQLESILSTLSNIA